MGQLAGLVQIAATVAEVSPDAVVVTGDTVSPAQVRLLSEREAIQLINVNCDFNEDNITNWIKDEYL